ncbi:alkaline phosphatase PhoX [Microbulbifer halophilus]|uniref:Alkaline phosphatase PhoX n=1 Tax=Microbulbifer halophilus TaxID=453963 RepID=A0ABW5EDV0_9GAMM|nr:alkaline phosphatase PhoX [Microbulbifer halophilus]MCW8126460.1 DUF839 domain-containing protein [Microbulbifer halophilus]
MLSRRVFLQRAGAAALAFGGLASAPALAQSYRIDPVRGSRGFGDLVGGEGDILHLPPGFSYRVLSNTGDSMSDGLLTPSAPDGMAAFPAAGNAHQCLLVRNHELDSIGEEVGPFDGKPEAAAGVSSRVFDLYRNELPVKGGTTTLLYDHRSGSIERSHLSLSGTVRNCAGGPTPWGSWLSCEETLAGPADGFGRDHGYVFEVPADSRGLVEPVPLRDMGRFTHEAAAVDSSNGIVYLTEDADGSVFYRFIPDTPGELARGGRLQALVIRGRPGAQTRNWPEDEGEPITTDQQFDCDWIDLEGVDNPHGDLAQRGVADGAASFCRCEGVAFAQREDGSREIFFAATGGGPKKIGQIWRYIPSPDEGTATERKSPGKLQLVYETRDRAIMESCDNLAVAPWGDLIVCEDSYSAAPDMRNYIRGITPEGKIYTLAMNAHSDKGEFCGACFSPDGSTLFVNIQRPGFTLAITGPWSSARARRA